MAPVLCLRICVFERVAPAAGEGGDADEQPSGETARVLMFQREFGDESDAFDLFDDVVAELASAGHTHDHYSAAHSASSASSHGGSAASSLGGASASPNFSAIEWGVGSHMSAGSGSGVSTGASDAATAAGAAAATHSAAGAAAHAGAVGDGAPRVSSVAHVRNVIQTVRVLAVWLVACGGQCAVVVVLWCCGGG